MRIRNNVFRNNITIIILTCVLKSHPTIETLQVPAQNLSTTVSLKKETPKNIITREKKKRERERERERQRQTDRERERQTDRQTGRQ